MMTWSRRSFSPLVSEQADSPGARSIGLIDAHVHVFPPEMVRDREAHLGKDPRFDELYGSPDARMATVEQVLGQMDDCGVELSVIFGFAFSDIGLCRAVNDYVLEAVKSHPGRLAGLACVPWGSPRAAGEVERCLDDGLRGCGEVAPASGDQRELAGVAPVADVLRERHLPLLVHASEPVGHAYPGKGRFTPEACVALAQMYPDLTLVLSHLGGGTFLYETMPELRAVLRDVLYDTAAIPYLYSSDIYELATRAVGAEKLIFGSDYPLLDPLRCVTGIERLSADEQSAVRAGNARRVYGV